MTHRVRLNHRQYDGLLTTSAREKQENHKLLEVELCFSNACVSLFFVLTVQFRT